MHIVISSLAALQARTCETLVSATASAANSRASAEGVSYLLLPEVQSLNRDASGGPCPVPLSLGPIVRSLESVTKAAFPMGTHWLEADRAAAGAQTDLSFR